MIYLSQEWETNDKLLGLLTTLFGKLDKDIRKQTLEEVYGLPLTKEIEKGVSEMCNLGIGIAEDYLQMGIEQGMLRGIEQGIEQNTRDTVQRMLSKNFSLEDIAEANDITVDEVIAIRAQTVH